MCVQAEKESRSFGQVCAGGESGWGGSLQSRGISRGREDQAARGSGAGRSMRSSLSGEAWIKFEAMSQARALGLHIEMLDKLVGPRCCFWHLVPSYKS